MIWRPACAATRAPRAAGTTVTKVRGGRFTRPARRGTMPLALSERPREHRRQRPEPHHAPRAPPERHPRTGRHAPGAPRAGTERAGVRDRSAARARRHGRGVSGQADRAKPHRRAEDAALRLVRIRDRPRTIFARSRIRRGAGAPAHREGVRVRRERRAPVLGDGVRAERLLGGARPGRRRSGARGGAHRRQTRGRGGPRAQPRGGSPRHQTAKRAHRGRRRTAAHRLRVGEGGARRPQPERQRPSVGNSRLYGPGTGRGQGARGRDRGRRVRAGRGAVRPAHGPAAVSGRFGRGHASESAHRGTGAAPRAEPGGAPRRRNDLPEVFGEGPGEAVRDRASTGRRPVALAAERADRGPPGGRAGAGVEVGETKQGGGARGRGGGAGAAGWRGRVGGVRH